MREVSLDEMGALALVLDVAPVHLFVPIDNDVLVQIAPGLEEWSERVREWVRGRYPLREQN